MALTPTLVPALRKAGLEVAVETGSGDSAGFRDAEYKEKGASVVSRTEIAKADVSTGAVRNWTVPVLCNGFLYCRNSGGDLVRVDMR